MKDLGCANNWPYSKDEEARKERRKIFEQCNKAGHSLTETRLSAWYSRYECKICGYKYEADHGD